MCEEVRSAQASGEPSAEIGRNDVEGPTLGLCV